MPEGDRSYQIRAERLVLFERGADTVIRAQVSRLGKPAPPTSATVSVFAADGTAIVDAEAATIAGGEARYTVAGSLTTGLELETGWRVEWTLTLDDGSVRVQRRNAALCVAHLFPAASLGDVFRVAPTLDPTHPRRLADHEIEELEGFHEDAWLAIEDYLVANGKLPWLVVSPQAFRTPHVYGTIARAYRDLVARGRSELAEGARDYAELAREALAGVPITLALDEEDPEATVTTAVATSVFLSGGRG